MRKISNQVTPPFSLNVVTYMAALECRDALFETPLSFCPGLVGNAQTLLDISPCPFQVFPFQEEAIKAI